MKNLKILFVSPQHPDYLADAIYHGLINLLGRKNVIDYPTKSRYHIPSDRYSYLLKTDPFTHFTMFLFKDNSKNELNKEILFDDFDVIIIGALGNDVRDIVLKVISEVPREKIVFIDGEDDPFVRSIYFKKIRKYFKRECLYNNMAAFKHLMYWLTIRKTFYNFKQPLFPLTISNFCKVEPLPFGIVDEGFRFNPPNEKIFDFCYIANLTSRKRIEIYNFLKDYAKKNKLNAFISSGEIKRNEYLSITAKSKIGISVRGQGFDTYRYWEIPYCGAMLISELPFIKIPNNFEEGKSAAFFSDTKELKEKIEYYLKNDRWYEIAKNGREHLFKYHTSIHRAKTVLESCVK